MIRRSILGLGAALVALVCSACEHAAQAVNETQAGQSSVPAVTTTTEAAPAIAAAKPATGGPAPPSGAPVPGDPNEVRRISLEEANALRESGRGVIVDVRDLASYSTGHIAGALHIPLAELAQRLGELPRDKPIVTYCA
ncbi:MAG TPA: rhodanese-like domain-containing protein [Thermoanaerobaculia bacterium]|nr:rhodanese-like domain-containing protein [Thermoanaerobaculia bacterium]HXT50791.1 rhodanese-like domain-containing protein [Thermoanaerobaculia bacterium]